MAAQQSYHVYQHNNKGALMPGQTITVNKYVVQVERYLSQGGFAQVYLVRTQTPVYNTTHHVLKHVVVANESMLTEVKKEVDVMRLLRGHPNIVYLIDAAWVKMPTGTFEVYILMEYCPGGGIIDMMNRRLRERLTEAEILQIFIEVCEGVAHMHHSRPPLLHRDLKVENILQSSATVFKLCDFGSTAAVSKPPSTSQEIRAVEADLNRHTTLQYRAPEMIDLHSRRPIDEKSDVWALGVLLYKLCYYTTPFEEHGPLAILNVQYRFPSYPVYSQQMMQLISSMLREHGSQRPSSFEILAHVHNLRGTKSAYSYPPPNPTPLSPRHIEFKSNPLDGVITYRQPSVQSIPKAQPVELAIPQERRGRSKVKESTSPSPSFPIKPSTQTSADGIKLVDDSDFGADGNAAWSSAIAKHTSMANQSSTVGDDAWTIQPTPGPDKVVKPSLLSPNAGFNDNFAQKLWASATPPNANKPASATPGSRPQAYSPNFGSPSHTAVGPTVDLKPKPDLQVHTGKARDAFEGLGLMTPISKPVPTLGEARKLRTGLAIMSTNIHRPIKPSPSPRLRPKAHTPRVSPIPTPRSLEPDTDTWLSSRPAPQQGNLSAETRFPSLEELDATFSTPRGSPPVAKHSLKQERESVSRISESPALPPRPTKVGSFGTGVGLTTGTKPLLVGNGAGARSEQATGIGIREPKETNSRRTNEGDLLSLGKQRHEERGLHDAAGSSRLNVFNLSRPQLSGQRSQSATSSDIVLNAQSTPSASYNTQINRSRDLLTGDDEPDLPRQIFDSSKLGHDMFKIRDSPSKRASIIERSDILEATVPQQGRAPTPPTKQSPVPSGRAPIMIPGSPTVSRFMKAFPVLDTSAAPAHSPASREHRTLVAPIALRDAVEVKDSKKNSTTDPSSSEDEGPEEPTALSSAKGTVTEAQQSHKGRQSSVHDLVDLWGGAVIKEKQPEPPTTPISPKPNSGAIKPRSAHIPQARPPSPSRKMLNPVATPQGDLPLPKLEQPRPASGETFSPPSKSGRARPQSMFIFPSQSTDTPSASAALLLPDDTKARPSRRTSISDMVQRFEAIQGNTRVTGSIAPPSPINVNKPSSTRDHLFDSPSSRPTKSSLEKIAVALPGLVAPSTSIGGPIKRRSSLTVPSPRPLFSTQRVSPTSSPSVSRPAGRIEDTEVENIPPRQRKISALRSEPIHPTPMRKTMLSMEELTKQPQPESAVSTSSTSNDRSSSPERPYQGVGKLIDQWQRKTAEAEASRNVILPKRTSLAPSKRVGLVPNHSKGS